MYIDWPKFVNWIIEGFIGAIFGGLGYIFEKFYDKWREKRLAAQGQAAPKPPPHPRVRQPLWSSVKNFFWEGKVYIAAGLALGLILPLIVVILIAYLSYRHIQPAQEAYARGDYDAALMHFDAALEISPENALALEGRGNTYLALGQPEQAAQDFTATLAIEPDHAGAYFGRGEANELLDNSEQALADYKKSRSLDPDRELEVALRLGRIYYERKEFEQAIEEYQRAHQRAELIVEIRLVIIIEYNIGIIYHDKGDPEEGLLWLIRAYQRAEAIDAPELITDIIGYVRSDKSEYEIEDLWGTATPALTPPPSKTPTPSQTASLSISPTASPLASASPSATLTATATATLPSLPSATATNTPKPKSDQPEKPKPPTKTPTPTPPASAPCNCSGPDLDCSDFETQQAAQACFNYCWKLLKKDIFELDDDGDKIACEDLPSGFCLLPH
jgi:tetratricopeptide (TPR) repeat protein